jgi:hypothetical protein
MKHTLRSTFVSVAVAAAFALALPVSATAHSAHETKTAPATNKAIETKEALRDLWLGHVFWVRNVAVETLDGNTAAAAAAEAEVVVNAKQIAAAIEPFYGKAASDKLFQLLAHHYAAVKQYLDATVAGSSAKQNAAWKDLTANADEIAVFLSSANPNLPVDTLRSLLLAHGGHHVQQIKQLHDKQYAAEAQTWAAMKQHMYVIADALAGAIAKQFPEKFK